MLVFGNSPTLIIHRADANHTPLAWHRKGITGYQKQTHILLRIQATEIVGLQLNAEKGPDA